MVLSEDAYFERQQDIADVQADIREREIEDRVWALTQKGCEFYPWSALHIQEALAEASLEDMVELQEAAESNHSYHGVEFGCEAMRIVRDYWERLARGSVE